MKILHGIWGEVEIVHRAIHLIAGAIGVGEVKGSLEKPGLVLEASQSLINRLRQGV